MFLGSRSMSARMTENRKVKASSPRGARHQDADGRL